MEANSLALSVCSRWSHPAPPKWEALAIHAKFPVSPEAPPLGELASECETERATPISTTYYENMNKNSKKPYRFRRWSAIIFYACYKNLK